MKYCLQLTHHPWTHGDTVKSVATTVETAKRADRAGFDSVWVSEDPEGWDAIAVLSLLARETERIRLGTGVTNPFLRHPNLIAASLSTLDRISKGRAFLGLGRGQPEWYRAALGMPAESPLRAVESTVSLLRQWWQPPNVANGDTPFRVRNWERMIAPINPELPIYLAGVGPRMIELAGRVADGLRINEMASHSFLRDSIERFRTEALQSGRDPRTLSIFVHPSVTITDDPEFHLVRKKRTIAIVHALPGMQRQLETPEFDINGIMDRVRGHMRTDEVLASGGGFPALRREGDISAAIREIPSELVNAVAIVGNISHVRSRLKELAELGTTHVFLDVNGLGHDDRTIQKSILQILPESR